MSIRRMRFSLSTPDLEAEAQAVGGGGDERGDLLAGDVARDAVGAGAAHARLSRVDGVLGAAEDAGERAAHPAHVEGDDGELEGDGVAGEGVGEDEVVAVHLEREPEEGSSERAGLGLDVELGGLRPRYASEGPVHPDAGEYRRVPDGMRELERERLDALDALSGGVDPLLRREDGHVLAAPAASGKRRRHEGQAEGEGEVSHKGKGSTRGGEGAM